MSAEFLSTALPAAHGFFTRRGGVSQGPYASLNGSLSGGDDPGHVARNRALAAQALGADPARIVGLAQVHGIAVATVTAAWAPGQGPRADAMVTRTPGLALGIITADCAPVLLADPDAGVVAAIHAGWRGAVAGVIEAAIEAMLALGAARTHIQAAVGPCIGQASYEVGADLRDAVLAARGAVADPAAFFRAAPAQAATRQPAMKEAPRAPADAQAGGGPACIDATARWHFDLAGYCAARLDTALLAGEIAMCGRDTAAEPELFFSHRRRTLAGGGVIGHQMSVIVAPRNSHG